MPAIAHSSTLDLAFLAQAQVRGAAAGKSKKQSLI